MNTLRTRGTLQRGLEQVRSDIVHMGSLRGKRRRTFRTGLKDRDVDLAQQVINDDSAINQLRYTIEEECLELIATQQPAAGDLRMVMAAMHVAVELERMADHAEGNAEITKRIYREPLLKPLIDIPAMARIAREMIHAVIDAFMARDADAALKIAQRDDEI